MGVIWGADRRTPRRPHMRESRSWETVHSGLLRGVVSGRMRPSLLKFGVFPASTRCQSSTGSFPALSLLLQPGSRSANDGEL